jgi:hypothetical protein
VWITKRAGKRPPVVIAASPVAQPPIFRHSSRIAGPPARCGVHDRVGRLARDVAAEKHQA